MLVTNDRLFGAAKQLIIPERHVLLANFLPLSLSLSLIT